MTQTLEKQATAFKLDKKDWQLVKFGDVAIQQKQKVDRENTDLTLYVKGEHMFSEDLHLREWGELRDEYLGPAFIRKFEEGDILYGSRRTYLRKVVIAPFEGITSNTTFVVRANEKKVDKRLLPFIMMSEGFTQHSIRNSKGSVNPYVNWKDLSGYEFLLPSKEEQSELAELLWMADSMIESNLFFKKTLKFSSQVIFNNLVNISEGRNVALSDILIPKKQKSYIPHERERYIGLKNIVPGEHKCTSFESTSEILAQCNVIEPGDLCYSKLRPYLDKAFIADFAAISTTELLIYETKLASSKYILYHLHSDPFIRYISEKGFGTKMPRVSHKIIGEYSVKIPNDERAFLDKMSKFENVETDLSGKIDSIKMLLKSLINKVF